MRSRLTGVSDVGHVVFVPRSAVRNLCGLGMLSGFAMTGGPRRRRIKGVNQFMGIQRITQRFEDADGVCRLLPYFTAGFPTLGACQQLIRHADSLNVAAIEIGFPYSDSIADGPVIQNSFHHMLQHGLGVSDCFTLAASLRGTLSAALIAMVSYSLVHRIGVESFMARAANAGFDGVILPDLPVDEAADADAAASGADLAHIGLVAPTTAAPRRDRIAQGSTGFVYMIAQAGTTGERSALPASLSEDVAQLKASSKLPVCVGFGISTPDHVRSVCRVADGAIIGSAIVRRVADAVAHGQSDHEVVEAVAPFITELAVAAKSRGTH